MTTLLLSSCVSQVWTGANLVYSRHSVYKSINDYRLAYQANLRLFSDNRLKKKDITIDLATFQGDLLLAGHVPTEKDRALVKKRLQGLEYRKLYLYLALGHYDSMNLEDNWITTKIVSQIIADSSINPALFKIMTVDKIVYVMGYADKSQAARVLHLASQTKGVVRVVKLLKSYHFDS